MFKGTSACSPAPYSYASSAWQKWPGSDLENGGMGAAGETRVTGSVWPQPEQQQEGAGRVLAQPDGPLLPSPAHPGWLAHFSHPGRSAPAPAGHLSHASTCVRLSLAAPRPCTLGVSDCTLPVTLPLTTPCRCSVDPPGGRRPPLHATPSHVVAAEAL